VPGLAAGDPYTVGLFGNWSPAFVDRNHRYTNATAAGVAPEVLIPPYLLGQEYIMSGNDNRDNAAYTLDVTVSSAVRVYMLIDNRLGAPNSPNSTPPQFGPTKMQWILDEGWTPVQNGLNRTADASVPDEVGIDESADNTHNQWYSVYSKDFPAGTFRLKQADNAGQNMYGVVVAPAPRPLPKFANVGANPIGTASFDQPTGTFTIVGGGNDIWNQQDEFAYAYDNKVGDFDLRVRVASLTPNARWSKAGIMVRESLAEDSRMLFLRVTPPDVPTLNGGNGANDIKLGYRTGAPDQAPGGETDGEHEDPTDQNPPPYPNAWLRVVRSGNVFSAHISSDGNTWAQITSQDAGAGNWLLGGGSAFRKDALVGLAVSRHSGGPSATAVFRDIAFQDAATFGLTHASSRGNPNAILVAFNKAPDQGTLVPGSFDVLGLNITSVTPGPYTHSYWLNVDTATTPLVEGTDYTVTAFNVTAGGGTESPVPDSDTFKHGAGFENVGVHVGHNKEPVFGLGGHRSRTFFARGLYSTAEGRPGLESNGFFEDPLPDTGSNERFTSTIFGLLNVTTAGDYQFACSSDDIGELLLSSDANPANKRLIAREPQWNGSRQYAVADRRPAQGDLPQNTVRPNLTPNLTLAAGEYYLEYVFNEGGGGNNGSVTWAPAGTAIANGRDPITAAQMALSRYHNGSEQGVLFRTLGAVSITRQPASQTVIGGSPVTFSVGVDGTPAYRYQWRKNGQPILGANGPSYSIVAAVLADEGAYSVSVANEFSSASSANANLVVNIPTPPVAQSAAPDETFARVAVQFDKRLQASSAQNPANYSISGGVTVNSATLDASGTRVVLATTRLAEGVTYTLTIRDVREITGNNALSPNPTTLSFQTLVFSKGFAKKEYYRSWNGGAVSVDAFIAAVAAGTTPLTTSCFVNLWEQNTSDEFDNYGGRILGFFVPPVSGDYVFYLSADDQSRLFLSTDADPANKAEIAFEPQWNGRRQWVLTDRRGTTPAHGGPQDNISRPITLVGGQRYFMESYFTEGGGGDNMAVAVQGPGAAAPANGDLPVGGAFLGSYGSPAGASASITQHPVDQTRAENTFATFTGAGTASSTACGSATAFQWFRNGLPIIGANSPTLSYGPVTPADNGSRFQLCVSTVGAQAFSAEAVLTVVAPQPLRVVRAEGVCNLRQVRVVFDQFVDETTSQDTFNYTSDSFGFSSAVRNPDNLSVTLTLDANSPSQMPGSNYCVRVGGVTSTSGLTVDPNPTTVCFPACVVSCGFAQQELYGAVRAGAAGIGGVAISDLTNDPRYPNSPDLVRYVGQLSANNVDEFDNYGTRISGWIIPPITGPYVFYLASDDGGDFALSTDENPANLSIVATEPVWAARRNYIGEADGGGRGTPPSNITAPIILTAGAMYYFEARMKEGGGGDNLDVAWQIPGGPAPVDGSAPISGAFLASLASPAGASVNITQQPANACAEEGTIATFTVAVTATTGGNPATSIFYQWYRMRPGGDWAPIGGATSATYAPTVGLADDGNKYRVAIYVPGATATSTEATLDVYHVNTAPRFAGGADQTTACAGSASVPGWATGILPHSITRTPTTLASAFASPAGITLAGVATVADGALKLTGLAGSQYGAGSASFPLRNFESLSISWKSLIGGSGDGADGYSLNLSDDIPADPGYGGEEGIGNGLRLTVDTFDNGGGEDGIDIKWRGNQVAFQQIPKNDPGTGVYLRKNTFVDATASVDAAGLATFTYDGQTISATLPGYTGVSANRVLFWARTGGAFDNHWIDDFAFQGFPYDASSVENSQALTFQVTANDNPGLFASGPAISANGTLSYTLAAGVCGEATLTVVLRDDAGTATCAGPRGSDTSAPYTFKIRTAPDFIPPTLRGCPTAPIVLRATSPAGAVATYDVTASDNCCLVRFDCTPPSGSVLPVGTNRVCCTAVDAATNSATCCFTVIVIGGNDAPIAVIHSDQLIDLSPEFDNPVLISCNWWNACLVADGLQSRDPEGQPLTYLWFSEPDGTVIGAGPVITNCLEVGDHTITLDVTDPEGATGSASLTISVVTAPLAIELLIEQINEAHKNGVVLTRKIKRELTETLRVALGHAGRERLRETQKALDAFEKKVRAQVAKTHPEAATAWIRWSQAISEGMEKCLKPPRKPKDHDDDEPKK
jgi:hypothetical protein